MALKIARDVKYESLSLAAKGHKQAEIADSLGISDHTIHHAKATLKKCGNIEGGARNQGHKPKLTP